MPRWESADVDVLFDVSWVCRCGESFYLDVAVFAGVVWWRPRTI